MGSSATPDRGADDRGITKCGSHLDMPNCRGRFSRKGDLSLGSVLGDWPRREMNAQHRYPAEISMPFQRKRERGKKNSIGGVCNVDADVTISRCLGESHK